MACQSGQHWSSARAGAALQPALRLGGSGCRVPRMCTPGSRGDGTARPATLVSAARGCNRLRGPSPALLTSAAQRPRAPAATRSSRTPRPARSTGRARAAPAAGPPPRSPGPRVAPPASRGPKTAESAAPRGPGTSRQRELGTRGDPRGPGGARLGRGRAGGSREAPEAS